MSARSDLATAANVVAGVKCSPNYRQTTRPGDGWVRLDTVSRDDTGFGFMCSWQVVLLLPQAQADAENWIDARLDDLLDALADEGAVTTAQPVSLAIDTGTVPALVVTVIRPKE